MISYRMAICSTIIFFLFNCSCSEVSEKNNPQSEKAPKKEHAIIKKPGSSFNDTIIISANSAVFYRPDSLQMSKIKAVNEKNIFDMITHNCHYQMQNAKIEIKKYWPQLKIIETSKTRYLLFVKANKTKVCIDLNDKNDICGLFLFDGEKNPVLVDMPNIDTQLGFYFSQ